jgi:hypothetical protein
MKHEVLSSNPKKTNEGWRHGSSNRELALQVQSHEFKPQYYHQKKKQTKGGMENAYVECGFILG